MISPPLLIFDFDGVIVDGMHEYWWSSRQACLELLNEQTSSSSLPEAIPKSFIHLRPWVHHGWEMVLLAAEFVRDDSPLLIEGARAFSKNYQQQCKQALQAWDWEPAQLQAALESVRNRAISKDLTSWLAKHQAFPGVIKRLNQLNLEGIKLAVLTTKSAQFTAELLNYFQLQPNLLYGRESGSKPEVLLRLSIDYCLKGFVEDRRATLETVLHTPGLNSLPCYLASWGYLKPEDKNALPQSIRLLEPESLSTPLASWS